MNPKTRVSEAVQGKDLVILANVVLTQYRSVTDRRTDRRTDASTIAKTHEALYAVARKNRHCIVITQHHEITHFSRY